MIELRLSMFQLTPKSHKFNLLLIFVGFTSICAGCSRELPVSKPSAIATVSSFTRYKDQHLLTEPIKIEVDEGYYIVFTVNVSSDVPDKCSDPLLWKCELVFLDTASTPPAESVSICQSLNPFQDEKYAPIPFHRPGPQIKHSRQQTAPSIAKKANESAIPFSAFIGAPFKATGNYHYELRLYPYFRWKKPNQFDPGDAIVVKQGTLQVVATKKVDD